MQDDHSKTMGKGMLLMASIMAMALLTLFFADLESKQRNPNQHPISTVTSANAEVVLERNRAGHYMVTGSINNQEVEFLLDTGATHVVIPARIAESIGLPFGRATRAMTANGPITVYTTRIDDLRIGAIHLTDVPASINPAAQPGILLGMSALKQIEFVQRGNLLTLRQVF